MVDGSRGVDGVLMEDVAIGSKIIEDGLILGLHIQESIPLGHPSIA